MEQYRKLGVFLNDEPGDEEALAFTAIIARSTRPLSIACVHVRGMEAAAEPASESNERVRSRIFERLPPELHGNVSIEVCTGTGVAEILRCARADALDLIIVGRRPPHDQLAAGTAFARLARKAPCSVLVAVSKSYAHLGRALVPVDGSPHSRLALDTALDIVRRCGDKHPQLMVQQICEVGYGYSYTGLNFADAIKKREELALRELDEFLGEFDSRGVELQKFCTCSRRPIDAVLDLAAAMNLDFIAVGSRGQTATAAFLLGSFAERLILQSPVPVLVVKRKGETLHLLDALLGP